MLSWRGTMGGGVVGTDFDGLLILLLLGDSEIAQGASPKTTFNEEPMQVDQRGDIGMWHTDLHAGAGGRIQHPGRQNNDHTRRRLAVDNPTTRALLTALLPNTAPVE
jgi:hypothetical protein